MIAPLVIALAATNYIYPLDSWQVATRHGEELSSGLYHMGVDAGFELAAGDPVYASADGIVREAQERTQFGLVVLLEHFPETGNPNVTLYGHLSPSEVLVTPGQTVQAGDQIGLLGDETENGGWTVHLHYGIHKHAYTGEWVYYGHVHDPATAQQWYKPEKYIAKHLVEDKWKPTLEWDFTEGQIVGDTVTMTTDSRDVGSGIASVNYKVSADGGRNWSTLTESFEPRGLTEYILPLDNYSDGDIWLQVVARDYFDNTVAITKTAVKDPQRYTLPAFVAIKGEDSDAYVTTWSFGKTVQRAWFPFKTTWHYGGDVAVADVNGDGRKDIITVRGAPTLQSIVKIFSADATLLNYFTAFDTGDSRIAAGDITSDGKADIIVGSGKNESATVRAFKRNGALQWELMPFGPTVIDGIDVAAADVNGDARAEVIAGTRSGAVTRVAVIASDGSSVLKTFTPFAKHFTGGVNVAAGDVTGDGQAEIIVGSISQRPGTVRWFNSSGEQLGMGFRPFGDSFTGSVDVSTVQWDTTNTMAELVVSQASAGQAWVKIYRTDDSHTIVSEQRVYEPDFYGGTRLAGWSF